ncbi:asparagine synthase-related protein [Janibacter cremeus]|uniref:asparagine synthase-related protein n=1 Tax=Janibacter cremeus TaxID=1285192 RepID=UPI003D64F864
MQRWSKLTWHRDGPVSEPADGAGPRLAEAARELVTVVLSRGAVMSSSSDARSTLRHPRHEPLGHRCGAAAPVPPGRWKATFRSSWRTTGSRSESLGENTAAEQRRSWFSPFTTYERPSTAGGGCRNARHLSQQRATGRPPSRRARGRPVVLAPDNLLERSDRMSMAASLERRPPLLDHRLVELAIRLPSQHQVHRTTTRWP